MALYMFMASYTPEAGKTIMETDTNREEAARKAIEAAGGKLLGFYGLVGQEFHVALICEVPSVGDYIGIVTATTLGGAISKFKSIPMYNMDDMNVARSAYAKVKSAYKPPS